MHANTIDLSQASVAFTLPGLPDIREFDALKKLTPIKLARLDYTLFTSLQRLGTPDARLCQVLGLDADELQELRAIDH